MRPPVDLLPSRGVLLGVALVLIETIGLLPFRAHLSTAVPPLLFVLAVLVAGALGGRAPALLVAAVAGAVTNLLFLPPYGTLRIGLGADAIALSVFIAVALTVGTLAGALADGRVRARRDAERASLLSTQLQDLDAERVARVQDAERVRQLEEVDDQRAALLRSVSHDLRTPLATIRAVASDLRSGTSFDADTRNELLDIVGDEAERLDRLVANLLSMSRIEAGQLRPEHQAVDLGELIADCVGRLGRLFDSCRLVVAVADDLPLVTGDYTHLDQVLTNLLENAARHAPLRSTVTVSARTRKPGQVEVMVTDEGIGVPPHERHRIFVAFRRGEGSRSSGIGLAICKAVVEAHGGSIDVQRTEGGGATFVVALPARLDTGVG